MTLEGQTVVSYYATNNGGVSEAPHALTVMLDKTPPTVQFAGNLGVYGVLDTVQISCTATDSLSGVLIDGCRDISGPAYNFDPACNTISAEATDFAGNVGQGSTSFSLRVTYDDLCTLTRQFIAGSGLAQNRERTLGESLCAQLRSANTAELRGNVAAKRRSIAAYQREVNAQSPVPFSPTEVQILIRLTSGL